MLPPEVSAVKISKTDTSKFTDVLASIRWPGFTPSE